MTVVTLQGGVAPTSLGMRRGFAKVTLLSLALAVGGCYDFHPTSPEDPDPVPFPTVVSVTIQYTQPNGCVATAGSCSDPVIFFASWMRTGGEIQLDPVGQSHVWRGVASGVPVNFPPGGSPYSVRIYDPFLQDGPGVRYTGHGLTVGGELLTRFDKPGARDEGALVYVDEIGHGHNPF